MDESKLHSAGGKVKIAVEPGTVSSAVFSPCGQYRYRLVRRWERVGPMVLFVLQNPSTADYTHNDPTVAKCCRYAKRWGYSGVMIGNVCAYRSTDNKKLPKDYFDPVNTKHIMDMADLCDKIVLAYGKCPKTIQKAKDSVLFCLRTHGWREVIDSIGYRHMVMGKELFYLEMCKDRITPKHPLYLKEDLKPIPFGSQTAQDEALAVEAWESMKKSLNLSVALDNQI